MNKHEQKVLQWIHAYTGIHGNEVADQLAKEGSKKQQPKSNLSYQEAKTLIRNKMLADFKHINGGYTPQQDTHRLLSRHEQTMIFRLRTDHDIPAKNRPLLTTQPHEKDWHGRIQTTAHVLQSWPLHKKEREITWPTESSIGNKLHGTATDLRLTVRFIALTGLHIWQVYIEHWRRKNNHFAGKTTTTKLQGYTIKTHLT